MPPDAALLAIAIPTYNRADHLERLLERLAGEVEAWDDVVVYVSDNASPDHTASVIERFRDRMPRLQSTRHSINVGADENFCSLIDDVEARYVWLVGDDDVPHRGSVGFVRSLLLAHRPDTIYTPAEWVQATVESGPVSVEPSPTVELMTRAALARRVHVYSTFISGWIVRTELARIHPTRRFAGSNLVQLSWVFGALEAGDRHLALKDPILRATMANSGGYSALQVFGSSFARVTRSALDRDETSRALARAMIRRSAIGYLPGLVWSLRSGTLGDFAAGSAVTADLHARDAGGRLWLSVINFIATAPPSLARLVTRATRVLGIAIARADDVRARITQATKRL